MKTHEYGSIIINPAVLRWLIENDGRDTETLSKSLSTNKLYFHIFHHIYIILNSKISAEI